MSEQTSNTQRKTPARRKRWAEGCAIAWMLLGVAMVCQPFFHALFQWGFLVTLAGIGAFIVASHLRGGSATMADTQVQLRGVEKRFGDFTAVERLDLDVRRGEFVVLLGPSGCGKTTTLRMIAGLETPTTGAITVGGRDVTSLRPGDRDIAFVFQMFALYPHLSVYDNVAFPLRAAGLARAEVAAHVARVAGRLGITPLLHRKPARLAGGDQQRVSLARAMVRNPAAFLMDEPLGTLDADQREHTRVELRAIHNELGATTVFVTHDQLEAMSLADRIAIMREGKLLQFASPRAVYDHPADLFVAHFIGSPGMNFLDAARTESGRYAIAQTNITLDAPHGHAVVRDRLTLGIRPEYVRLDPTGSAVSVEHTERLGSYNLLALRLGDQLLKARMTAQARFREGAGIHIGFDPEGIRWFDPLSGQSITQNEEFRNG